MKQNPLTTFDAGFFKEAEALGMDVNFLKGLVAENNEAVQKWSAAFDEIEQQTGDKHFRFKVAGELAELLKDRPATPMQKQANEMLQQILQWAQENPELTGGGIGGLLGLLLGHSAGHPLMGLLMGGLGGAGLGHFGKLQKWWGGGTPNPTTGNPTIDAMPNPNATLDRVEENLGGQKTDPMLQQPPAYNDPEADLLEQAQPSSQPGRPVTPQHTPVVPPAQPATQQQRGAPLNTPPPAPPARPGQTPPPGLNKPVVPPQPAGTNRFAPSFQR